MRLVPTRVLLPACLALLSLALPAVGQETPTQREAAKDVVQKMATLEKQLDVPALVAKLTGPNPARDKVTARAKALMQSDLLALSDDICRNPEVGYKEVKTVEKLAAKLRSVGFDVKVGLAGLDTAFVATWNGIAGGPNLGIIVEYDALRGTKGDFHGDQHCAQGPVGIAAAVAIKEHLIAAKVPGNVIVYGTPAEELMDPSAKVVMHKAGVFNGADVIVRTHSGNNTNRPAPGFGTCCLNIDGVRYTFSGAPAHQMTAWNGRNALTAANLLFGNIDAVRSNMRPEARIQGYITEGGAAPNVVPDLAQAEFYIRYPDEVYLKTVREFVDNAAKAAALATGTKVKIDNYGSLRDGISVSTLAEVGFAYQKQLDPAHVADEPGKPQGFEESGSVSRDIPGFGFSGYTSDNPYHTYEMNDDNFKAVGHNGFTVQAQAMTALLFDFATRADYRALVKKEFDGIRALFGEYIAALEKTYKNPIVPDPK